MSPIPLLVFPGITLKQTNKTYCHILIHELIMTRGMDNSDCVYQGFMPPSNPGLVETPVKTHGPQMAEVLFPRGNLGGNYQRKKE